MDGLAKNLGLDIEKIAVELAMRDDSTPATQVHLINDDEKIRLTLKKQASAFRNVESKNSTPCVPLKEYQKGVLSKVTKKSSPIITPIVLRQYANSKPKQQESPFSHASGANISPI